MVDSLCSQKKNWATSTAMPLTSRVSSGQIASDWAKASFLFHKKGLAISTLPASPGHWGAGTGWNMQTRHELQLVEPLLLSLRDCARRTL